MHPARLRGLPNHVVGKGVIKALRAAYPGANIVAVDYDPGASEVNQLNRIKLMLTAAQRALHAQVATPKKPQPPEAPSISLPHPKVASSERRKRQKLKNRLAFRTFLWYYKYL